MSREKIARKKLLQEPDEFLSLSQRVWLWVHQNQQKTAVIAGGVVAVVLLAIGVKGYSDRSHGQRSNAVAAAVARYTAAGGAAVPAELQQELSRLAERYAGSPEGDVARYFHAGALAAAGETEKARQVFASLAAATTRPGDLALLARQSIGYLDLAGGTLDAALSTFQDVLKTQGRAVARAQIKMEIAAIHEKQGRAAEARRLYQDVLVEHPEGSWAATAKERLRLLGEAVPSAS